MAHLLAKKFRLVAIALLLATFSLGQSTRRFELFQEFYGDRGYTDPLAAEFLRRGIINGLAFSPPVESGVSQLAGTSGASLMLRLPAAAGPAGISQDAVDKQRANFEVQSANNPRLDYVWNVMPEWDQSGGAWVSNGRPVYRNLSRPDAYAKFIDYYRRTYPALMTRLTQPSSDRKYRLAAVTDHSPNTFYAYELGVDICLLERAIDELGDLSTGMAFLRGASRQYGRPWGIDISSWRTSNNDATWYSNGMELRGGWSASYLARHFYGAFLAGANVIHNEAATFRQSDGRLNPLGDALIDFADFALRRHPDVGSPVVSTAFMIDHASGFDPRHGVYNQSKAVWYQDIPFSSGDFMIDNVLRLAYPGHWQHGLTPTAPFANSTGVPNSDGFRAFLARGGDPRPFEPMPSTRWGDNVDIITTNAKASALGSYKTIVLLGDVHLDSRLRGDLRDWVMQGGTLVMNAAQLTADDQTVAGVSISNSPQRSASFSRWLDTGVSQREPAFNYVPIGPGSAQVVAVDESSNPLLTRNKLGTGEVWLATPLYLQSSSRDQFLSIGMQLLDTLIEKNSIARISGPPVEYIVNQSTNKLIVGVINNSGDDWNGTISAARSDAVSRVLEYTTDQSVAVSTSAQNLTIPAQVPAYGVRVFAIEYSSTAQN